MQNLLGETLRPGGFKLTEIALKYCGISETDKVLDLGCGRGATLRYLSENHGISAAGIDPSEMLLADARTELPEAELVLGRAEALPFESNRFDCVFAECTLSLMESTDEAINQTHRVLKPNGWFIISDVYAKNPQALPELRESAVNSCMRGMHELPVLEEKLRGAGFSVALTEDYSEFLKELLVKIGFSYGSMSSFWNLSTDNCVDGGDFDFKLKQCKPGYFLLIARK
ncbi:MAG: class I SAM-dependent methyltransferase [Clostridia bacterium]|nr:class I SAM-dependent methyltransferase [Clostridia bacterium]